MNKRQIRNTLLIMLVCAAVSFAFNDFLSYRQARTPSHLRQTMGDSAASACRSSPDLKAVATGTQLVRYCNCYVDTVLRSMSDAEITAAADRKSIHAGDRAKAVAAQQQCQGRLHEPMGLLQQSR